MSNNKITEFAEIFKALSNPNRLKIFVRLASCCAPGTVSLIDDEHTAYVGEISSELNVGKSTVSHHIKELRRVGLLRSERRGQKIACWVDPEMVKDLTLFFDFTPVVQIQDKRA
ncbi:MAG: winged helix-turn-helix transcriptional regulator [Deltaproteobacteria bacterium]|nr:winged helix-turn-helix transcriptional regulator [Deltaproteobacteria bacterium]